MRNLLRKPKVAGFGFLQEIRHFSTQIDNRGLLDMPLKLFALAEKEGIVIEWWDFQPPLEAVYWVHRGLPPVIGLAHSLSDNRARLRCVLAEELGHHFTGTTYAFPRTFFHYRGRLEISWAEYRALKWAALYLMPEKKLHQAINKGVREKWELAEYFNVTEQIVDFRLRLPEMVVFNMQMEACSFVAEEGIRYVVR